MNLPLLVFLLVHTSMQTSSERGSRRNTSPLTPRRAKSAGNVNTPQESLLGNEAEFMPYSTESLLPSQGRSYQGDVRRTQYPTTDRTTTMEVRTMEFEREPKTADVEARKSLATPFSNYVTSLRLRTGNASQKNFFVDVVLTGLENAEPAMSFKTPSGFKKVSLYPLYINTRSQLSPLLQKCLTAGFDRSVSEASTLSEDAVRVDQKTLTDFINHTLFWGLSAMALVEEPDSREEVDLGQLNLGRFNLYFRPPTEVSNKNFLTRLVQTIRLLFTRSVSISEREVVEMVEKIEKFVHTSTFKVQASKKN